MRPNESSSSPAAALRARKHVVVVNGHVECAAGASACMTLAWILLLFGSWRTVDTAGDRRRPQTRNGRATVALACLVLCDCETLGHCHNLPLGWRLLFHRPRRHTRAHGR